MAPQPKRRPMWRCNVAAVVVSPRHPGKVLGCLRADHPFWQTVQGGVEPQDTSLELAIQRELGEELGLAPHQTAITHRSSYWRRYGFPPHLLEQEKKGANRPYIGQDQLWFLVTLVNDSPVVLPPGGEFQEATFMAPYQLAQGYVWWKKRPFVDFCQECGLLP